jgi:multidrug efflux pump subunit AcrB
VASYLLSNTFVPVLSVWLLRHHVVVSSAEVRGRPGLFSFARFRNAYAGVVRGALRVRWAMLPAYVGVAVLAVWLAGGQVGREIFPNVDAGQFQLRLRASTGTRIERTEEITQQALEIIKETVGPHNVAISLGYVGVVPSSFPINGVYQWMSGPEEAVVRVALKHDSGIGTEKLKQQLREELPSRLADWLRPKLVAEGFTPQEVEERVRGVKLSFEPADIVNTVMSFGSPTPIEIVVSGPNFADNRAHAEKVKKQLEQIASLSDLQYGQPLDYPTVEVKLDRELAGRSGVKAEDVARSLVAATASSRFVVPNYWRDPKSGIGYQVQVEVPIERMNSSKEVGQIPIRHAPVAALQNGGENGNRSRILLQDVAQIQEGAMPGEYDRYNMRRLVSMTANVQGADLGTVAGEIAEALKRAGDPPRGVQVDVRGQVEPMQQMFTGLAIGLGMAVLVIFLLLAAYFQSFRLAFVSVTTAPAVIAGVALALWVTGTTLNIQSFMGAIMAMGVATANAILLVTFAERSRRAGASATGAAVDGAESRLRAILMTSCAMIAGMLPMALALGEGGQQVAPLGRAVIGGLIAATLATLLVLPCVFAAVQGRSSVRSVSLDPDDPESPHLDRDQTTAVRVLS